MGLVPALTRLLDNFTDETGIHFTTDFPKQIQISSDANICLFRIVQGALMNVYKHAEASTVEVSLQRVNNTIILAVVDNGKGFDISKGLPWVYNQNKLGLLSMKERVSAIGGNLVIDAAIDRGCRIEAEIPLSDKEDNNGKD
jgi:two-component system sensor histidine kinase DegS